MQVHKTMRRSDTMYIMDAEVVVVFLDFHKYQTACNLLVEKLDETVSVGVPEFYHASTTLETLRFDLMFEDFNLNSLLTDDDAKSFCGQCRSRSDCKECAV